MPKIIRLFFLAIPCVFARDSYYFLFFSKEIVVKNYTYPLSHQVYTAEQVRELDRLAMASGSSGLSLMIRAGQFMFDSIRQSRPNAKSLLIFCGVGNNAGDGYIIARLALEADMIVQVVQLGGSLQGDALLAQTEYFSQGGKYETFDFTKKYTAEIIVDALLGTGLSRNVEGEWAKAIAAINACSTSAYITAVDIPSGLNATTGALMGDAVIADETVTFVARKCGLYTGKARDYVGKLRFSDLAIADSIKQQFKQTISKKKYYLLDHTINLPKRKATAHKGSYGHVLFIGGTVGMSGSIRMAAEAALTVGAGLITVLTHPSHAAWLSLNRPELMVNGIESPNELLPYLHRANVIAIGPGLGTDQWGRELFNACLATEHDKIIDADGLNLLSHLSISRDNWVLTPHSGEAARLLGVTAQAIEMDRYYAAIKIQQHYSGYCILKGAGSLITDGKQIAISTLGNPGMATAGMGDVLTGIIAGLRAQGMTLQTAARLGVTLHAKAADLAVAEKGERGLFATELYPYLRTLVN
ncbi:MAG TPA: NAD(P)H-hydrate dehydratase [Leucothrix mucor]|uniref:Bifunctional NAD(P)H-hydrate repair enzyme n=1 Tax=Leucothrix mucor TaxID=45248 RepID=A0A7V2WW00_LEUMU|nr:NAD(P)H-hydrate dehydratase [Leucothrix mucor]